MGIVVPDIACLREPNLLIPGKKPVGPVKIDWDHPLAEGLYDIYILGDIYKKSIVTKRDILLINDINVNPLYLEPNIIDTGSYLNLYYLPIKYWTEATFILQFFRTISDERDIGRHLGIQYSGGDDIRIYNTNGTANGISIAWDDGSTSTINIPESDIPDGMHTIAITHNGSLFETYLDGKFYDSIADTFTFSGTSGLTYIGSSPSFPNSTKAKYYNFTVYNRALSAEEIKEQFSDPYQFLIPA